MSLSQPSSAFAPTAVRAYTSSYTPSAYAPTVVTTSAPALGITRSTLPANTVLNSPATASISRTSFPSSASPASFRQSSAQYTTSPPAYTQQASPPSYTQQVFFSQPASSTCHAKPARVISSGIPAGTQSLGTVGAALPQSPQGAARYGESMRVVADPWGLSSSTSGPGRFVTSGSTATARGGQSVRTMPASAKASASPLSKMAGRQSPAPPKASSDHSWKLKLGAEVPNFYCETTTGNFMFHDYVSGGPPLTILFTHPKDFTPVCTTELGRCEILVPEFEARGVQLIGLSCDPVDMHLAWATDILMREQIHKPDGRLSFPVIADTRREIVTRLGMLDPEEVNSQNIPLPARALMVISKDKKVKLAIVYPATTGRNFIEVLRVVDSLGLTADSGLATPADWAPGDRCIVDPKVSTEEAGQRFDDLVVEDLPSGKTYLRHVKCPPMATGGAAPSAVTSGIGISVHENTREAVHEAVVSAVQGPVPIKTPSIVFASCTVDRNVEEVQAAFAEFLPDVPIHGITSSGALLHQSGAIPNGVGCLIIDAPPGSFATAFADSPEEAASLLRDQMPTPQAIIMSTVPGSEESAIAVLNSIFGIPVYGGTAADNELNGEWRVFGPDRCSGTGISLVGIGMDVRFGAAMLGPYVATDARALITKAEGRRVYEINNQPASDWVYAWLGESVQDAYTNGGLILTQTAQFPIGFPLPSGSIQPAHLAALGGPEKYVDFFCPVMEGQEMIIMDAGDGPVTGYAQTLADAYQSACENGGMQKPQAGLLVFCGGMAIAVGDQLGNGLVNGLQGAGDVPILGLTCFGEQSYAPEDQANLQRNLSLGFLLFE